MGAKIYHFEDNILLDGTIHVNWNFSAGDAFTDDLSNQTRIKSHAVTSVYSLHTMVKPGLAAGAAEATGLQTGATLKPNGEYYDHPDSKFCYLIGSEIIDVAALMQSSIDVNQEALLLKTSDNAFNPKSHSQREYDFPCALQSGITNYELKNTDTVPLKPVSYDKFKAGEYETEKSKSDAKIYTAKIKGFTSKYPSFQKYKRGR